jgi:hypothetical protein
MVKDEAYLFWANHASMHGIGEIVFTIYACLSGRCLLKPTKQIRPGKINIIIDEFSNPHFVERLQEIKRDNPQTRYVIVATEFITPIVILGVEFSRTFNFFGGMTDWKHLLTNLLRQRTRRLPLYMHQRYLGFTEALSICDLLVFVHPQIGRELTNVAASFPNLVAPPVVIYPELTMELIKQHRSTNFPIGFDLRIGFNLTGTVTRYRQVVMRKLTKKFGRSGWHGPIWQHVRFDESEPIALAESGIHFHYDVPGEHHYLFNISPPQQSRWPYSSPMRIVRAALMGQIPVVTKKFNDHEIEDIAVLWDGRVDTALKISSYRIDRMSLLRDYINLVERYNVVAKAKNGQFLDSFKLLFKEESVRPAPEMDELSPAPSPVTRLRRRGTL